MDADACTSADVSCTCRRVVARRWRAGGLQEHPLQKRQRSLISTATLSCKDTSAWRPRKVHRTSAKLWCSMLDNQFRCCTARIGLAFFQPQAVPAGPWLDWRTWPHLNVAMDLGSDGNCGFHALERRFRLNIDQWNDPAHGCHRDLDLSIGAVGLHGFWLLLVVSMNMPHGPQRDGTRRNQVRETMNAVYKQFPDPARPPS